MNCDLRNYLQQYQPQTSQEKICTEILNQYCQLSQKLSLLKTQLLQNTSLSEQSLSCQKEWRSLQFQLKKITPRVYSDVFLKNPFLSRPRRDASAFYQDQYEIILNEVAAAFIERVCRDFQPNNAVHGKTLTEKLAIWIDLKLRLKFLVVEMTSQGKKKREIQLLEILLELCLRFPQGFLQEDFLQQIKHYRQQYHAHLPEAIALNFLQNQYQEFGYISETESKNQRYQFDFNQLQNTIQQLAEPQQLTLSFSDHSTQGKLLEEILQDLKYSPQLETGLTISQKIYRIFSQHRQELVQLKTKESARCHCAFVLKQYFLEKLKEKRINEQKIIFDLGIKRTTYQSHLERICLPKFWELAIHHSPLMQHQHYRKIFIKYITEDPQNLLKKCYYVGRDGTEYSDCNCQNLAQKRLILLQETPTSWPAIAREYSLTAETVLRFWNLKCLFLLSLIVFDLETEYTDKMTVD